MNTFANANIIQATVSKPVNGLGDRILKIIRKTVDGSVERKLLTGMVVSTSFLDEATGFYDPDLIEAKHVRIVAEWCVQYYQRYAKAPGIHIKDIYDSHADQMEPAEKELISDLLSGLSDEYERADKLNVPYLLDQAENYFKTQSLSNLYQEGKGLLLRGDVAGAEGLLSEYKRIGRPSSLGTNPFTDAEGMMRAFESDATPLFTFPGELGWMLNEELNRDKFLVFMGPEKRGKTWWCNEVAIRAAMARCNVALFQVGDMSEEQIKIRLAVRLAGKSNRERYCGEHECPTPNNSGIGCSYKTIPSVKPLTWRDAWKTGQRFLGRIKGRDFRLSVHPSDQLSVAGLKLILDNWDTFDNFIPDVIVIDYVDNLAPENRREEYRHQINRTWKLLRGLSQERHCLVATATQASADSYDQATISMKHFSENKLKNAHVTAMVGLNQTIEEKRARLMRLNMIIQREGEFYADQSVTVAQDLWQGRPFLFSFKVK